jgi:hypothetical protein
MREVLKALKVTVLGVVLFFIFPLFAVKAQQHNSVPLDHGSYYLIENAVMRGLCDSPPGARPWSEFTIREKLTEILNAPLEMLSKTERDIVAGFLAGFERKPGLEWSRGAYYTKQDLKRGSYFTFEGGVSWETTLSGNTSPRSFGTTNIFDIYLDGDLGSNFSYDFHFRPGFYFVERLKHNAYIIDAANTVPAAYEITSYFPYTFSGIWDGVIFDLAEDNEFLGWPDKFSFGYEVISEINASFVDNRLLFRFGRMRRDWGIGGNGTSLVLNAHARPFLALEGSAVLVDWLRLSTLTGVLEYYPKDGSQKTAAYRYQNAFSIGMLELNYKNYFHFDFGSSVIWPKRFELGYLYPGNSNLIYQNNVGDFDNLALFGDIGGQIPGIGTIWVSLFLDEIRPTLDSFLTLDRSMYAFQAGTKAKVPWLPFASLTLRYTKIEPYTYTHPYTVTPWYSEIPAEYNDDPPKQGMATAYINSGDPLGYYLPPNSDELLLCLETLALPGLRTFFQYQMIRHGVEYGPGRVDGSNLYDQHIYDENHKKYFLHDGTYQWSHILKVGGNYSLSARKIPLSFYGEFGIVITRFSVIDAQATDLTGIDESHPYYLISSNDSYKGGVGVILSLGIRIFP